MRFPEIAIIHQFVVVGVIIAVAWNVVALIDAIREIIDTRYRIDVADNLVARRIRTQVELLQRIAVTVVGVIALAAVLMSFPSVRQLGVSLVASAGVAGLVLGIAARPTLGNMIAGMQIALSQPIRIDDVVVVENEKPFTNWTRTGTSLLATVYFYADYRQGGPTPRPGERRQLRRGRRGLMAPLCGVPAAGVCAAAGSLVALVLPRQPRGGDIGGLDPSGVPAGD